MNTSDRDIPNRPSRQAGFILTMELMIILTVLGIGLLVGFFAVREALFKYFVTEQSKAVYITDANGTNMGEAIGFDEHEAPLLVYVDRSLDENYRALIGVRDDRFSSREPVYYTLPNCAGDPCMKRPSQESVDNQGVDLIPGSGAVSYLYALQQGPTYAIGAGPSGDRIKGSLFRAGTESCDVDDITASQGSRWVSQKVEAGEPCEPFVLPTSEVPDLSTSQPTPEPGLFCPRNTNSGLVCESGCDGSGNQCRCPANYEEFQIAGPARICCPAGTSYSGDPTNPVCLGDSTGSNEGSDGSNGGGLVYAVSVPSISDPSRNALEALLAPFTVNLPVDNDPDSWNYIPPDSEDGSELR